MCVISGASRITHPHQDDPHRYTIKEELGTGATATVCRSRLSGTAAWVDQMWKTSAGETPGTSDLQMVDGNHKRWFIRLGNISLNGRFQTS